MRKTALIALVVPLSLFAAACGDSKGSDLTAEEQAFADSISIGLTKGEAGIDAPADDVDCMAEAVVTEIGLDVFTDADLEPEDFETDASPGELLGEGTVSDEDAVSVIDEWQDCTDLPMALAASSFTDNPDGAECFADALDDELLDVVLVPAFTTEEGAPTDEDERQEVIDLVTECAEGAESDGAADDGATEDEATDDGEEPADVEALLIESLSAGFATSGVVDEPTAACLAEALVTTIGADRLYEAVGEEVDFSKASPELLTEIEAALQAAAVECDVPPEVIAGG
jgi:hypothetical protein